MRAVVILVLLSGCISAVTTPARYREAPDTTSNCHDEHGTLLFEGCGASGEAVLCPSGRARLAMSGSDVTERVSWRTTWSGLSVGPMNFEVQGDTLVDQYGNVWTRQEPTEAEGFCR